PCSPPAASARSWTNSSKNKNRATPASTSASSRRCSMISPPVAATRSFPGILPRPTHEEAPYLLLDDRAGRRGCLRHFHRAFLEDAQARAHFVPSDPPRPRHAHAFVGFRQSRSRPTPRRVAHAKGRTQQA